MQKAEGSLSSVLVGETLDESLCEFFRKPVPQVDKPSTPQDTVQEYSSDDEESSLDEPVRKRRVKSVIESEQNKKEKALRTIFVGNLALSTTKKELIQFFSRFGTIDSVRFRGIAYKEENKLPIAISAIKGDFNESRENKNAYIVFNNIDDALKSAGANNELLNQRHIRVDPLNKKFKESTIFCVFVGNIPFNILHCR
eukprot:TRINITY_DN126_c0_g1_i1.p1 TRINITY_DN126_c0_g1~~TRINITY_DN126_c0_g1_i1.p1  ORF type:complete len:198 (+),score=26.48 TRINITY_DN126_c0_g1_i1:67-660(+)